MNKIRNFCILAHVDHGKSTLADRFLELTNTVSKAKFRPQFLDSNPISRERGITIKLAPVRMIYQYEMSNIKGQRYILNLIDTPGHVDFSYEVSRSLAACEGAILLIDASKGIQAQTLSYFIKAKEQGLAVIPVVNKIDLPAAEPEKTAMSMIESLGFVFEEIIFISAKTGEGVAELLQKIVSDIPAPKNNQNLPLRALVFDSFYDSHKGVVVYVRVFDGKISQNDNLKFIAGKSEFQPLEIGYLEPQQEKSGIIENNAVGYIATGLKDIRLAQIGDTVTISENNPNIQPLQGYKEVKPMVFAGIYPIDQDSYPDLSEALQRLKLNDAALSFANESSEALGKGFRCGFLGPLHSEVVIARLEREFNLELINTAPNVEYIVKERGKETKVNNVSEIPESYDKILEPVVKGVIFTPLAYLGEVMELCRKSRGKFLDMEYIQDQVKLEYRLPLSEIIVSFFPVLKSVSSGFASFDYDLDGWESFEGIKLDILVRGRVISPLASIVLKEEAYKRGKQLVENLSEAIPKQMFEFTIQAAIGRKVIARITKKAWRKDVTAKLYGGDQTRKDKLLKKQKKGKKKMKAIGNVFIPQEAFFEVLKK